MRRVFGVRFWGWGRFGLGEGNEDYNFVISIGGVLFVVRLCFIGFVGVIFFYFYRSFWAVIVRFVL